MTIGTMQYQAEELQTGGLWCEICGGRIHDVLVDFFTDFNITRPRRTSWVSCAPCRHSTLDQEMAGLRFLYLWIAAPDVDGWAVV